MYTRKISSRFILILVVIQMILAILVGIVAPLSTSASHIQDENEEQNITGGRKVFIRLNPQSSDHYVPLRVMPLKILNLKGLSLLPKMKYGTCRLPRSNRFRLFRMTLRLK